MDTTYAVSSVSVSAGTRLAYENDLIRILIRTYADLAFFFFLSDEAYDLFQLLRVISSGFFLFFLLRQSSAPESQLWEPVL